MGHNFSANHDAGGSPYIMAPTISGSNIWSAISITAISAHAQSRGCAGGCSTGSNPPIANFKATPTTLCVPAMSQVQFMDLSSGNPISWLWSFPGGTPSTSTLQHPLITYSNHGKFEVTLQVTNSGGINAITFLEYIDVEEKPKPSWQHTILNRELTIFPNTSQYADTYLWKFGDGGTSTDAEPKHTYSNDGAYDLSLEVTNRCGTVKKTIRIFIVTKNSANFIGDVLRGCATHKVKYTNQSSTNSTSYLWEFPGGNPSSSTLKDPPVISYPNKGNFDVLLIASNSKYKDTLLRKKYVIVDSIPNSLFSFAPPIGPLVDFTSLSINELNYFWNFGDGQTSTEKDPSHLYGSPGIYTVIHQVNKQRHTIP
jgi:PKD repeat protein